MNPAVMISKTRGFAAKPDADTTDDILQLISMNGAIGVRDKENLTIVPAIDIFE